MIEKFDLAVIGGGPAGLISSGRAAELGAKVILLEKNSSPGIKLLMTGGGRCNFSNNSSIKNISDSLGSNGRWLISGLSTFGPEYIIDFFKSKGVEIKIEDDNRVFPKSNQAQSILNALISYAKEFKVEIRTNSKVEKVVKENNIISKIILATGQKILADKFIFACGGKSYPLSGSSGEVFNWLESLGHSIVEVKPALGQLFIKENLSDLEGLSFSDVLVFARKNNFKSSRLRGDIIFTKKGLSGPLALNLSRELTRQKNPLDLVLDFFPDKSEEELVETIKNTIYDNKGFNIKNVLALLVSKRMSSFLLDKINIDSSRKAVSINKSEIKKISSILKSNIFVFTGVGGFDEAMISSGGVSLKEVDNRTMTSKIISNLYLVGETLDLDGPTGGYNLQIAWTTGYLAGSACA